MTSTEYSISEDEEIAWNEIDKIESLFVGHKILKAEQKDEFTVYLTLDSDRVVRVQGNMGDYKDSDGFYYVTSLAKALPGGRIMAVSSESDKWEEKFTFFVMTEGNKMPLVEFEGSDNGYYGTGFWLKVL